MGRGAILRRPPWLAERMLCMIDQHGEALNENEHRTMFQRSLGVSIPQCARERGLSSASVSHHESRALAKLSSTKAPLVEKWIRCSSWRKLHPREAVDRINAGQRERAHDKRSRITAERQVKSSLLLARLNAISEQNKELLTIDEMNFLTAVLRGKPRIDVGRLIGWSRNCNSIESIKTIISDKERDALVKVTSVDPSFVYEWNELVGQRNAAALKNMQIAGAAFSTEFKEQKDLLEGLKRLLSQNPGMLSDNGLPPNSPKFMLSVAEGMTKIDAAKRVGWQAKNDTTLRQIASYRERNLLARIAGTDPEFAERWFKLFKSQAEQNWIAEIRSQGNELCRMRKLAERLDSLLSQMPDLLADRAFPPDSSDFLRHIAAGLSKSDAARSVGWQEGRSYGAMRAFAIWIELRLIERIAATDPDLAKEWVDMLRPRSGAKFERILSSGRMKTELRSHLTEFIADNPEALSNTDLPPNSGQFMQSIAEGMTKLNAAKRTGWQAKNDRSLRVIACRREKRILERIASLEPNLARAWIVAFKSQSDKETKSAILRAVD